MYLEGFLSVITDPEMYLVILLGVAVGIVFGVIPGLTATMAITMCLPMTYAMETKTAVCVLMALYIGGISGGSISAILLNIPGTPSSLATTFDGAPMAASGHAKKALGVGVFYSFIGTVVGLVILMGVAPQLSEIAIKFSPLEYCALAIFSLVLVIALAGKDMIKGLISGTLGLMFATVGLSPIDSMKRFSDGIFDTAPLIGISSHRHISSRPLCRCKLYSALVPIAAAFISDAILIQQPSGVDIQPPRQSIGLHIHAEKCRKLCGRSRPLLTARRKKS